MIKIKSIPKQGQNGDDVIILQVALMEAGFSPGPIDGDFGPRTKSAVSLFQKSKKLAGSGIIGPLTLKYLKLELDAELPPKSDAYWLDEAKKHTGKKETDSKFKAYLSAFWGKVGLPNYKTIVGTSFAWCGLFVAAMLIGVGLPWQKNGAGARNWAKYGQEVDYKKNGIPRGAIVHINKNCKSGSGNHVTFANGDCTPEDIKKGGSIEGFGGNQGNTAKVSNYAMTSICAVRWPPGIALPGKITKSTGCNGKKADSESTR